MFSLISDLFIEYKNITAHLNFIVQIFDYINKMFRQRFLSTDVMEFDPSCNCSQHYEGSIVTSFLFSAGNTMPSQNLSVADTSRFKSNVMHAQTQTLDIVVNHTSLSQQTQEQHQSIPILQKI